MHWFGDMATYRRQGQYRAAPQWWQTPWSTPTHAQPAPGCQRIEVQSKTHSLVSSAKSWPRYAARHVGLSYSRAQHFTFAISPCRTKAISSEGVQKLAFNSIRAVLLLLRACEENSEDKTFEIFRTVWTTVRNKVGVSGCLCIVTCAIESSSHLRNICSGFCYRTVSTVSLCGVISHVLWARIRRASCSPTTKHDSLVRYSHSTVSISAQLRLWLVRPLVRVRTDLFNYISLMYHFCWRTFGFLTFLEFTRTPVKKPFYTSKAEELALLG